MEWTPSQSEVSKRAEKKVDALIEKVGNIVAIVLTIMAWIAYAI